MLACACTRMRTSTGRSLGRQTQRRGSWPLTTAGAPITTTSVGGGRAEFVLHGEEPQTNSSANSDVRVFEAWMSWLHGSQPPDPIAARRCLRSSVVPCAEPPCQHLPQGLVMVRRGRSRFVRSSSSTRTVGLCACMWCGTSWTFTGKPRKGPLRRIPGRFRDESC